SWRAVSRFPPIGRPTLGSTPSRRRTRRSISAETRRAEANSRQVLPGILCPRHQAHAPRRLEMVRRSGTRSRLVKILDQDSTSLLTQSQFPVPEKIFPVPLRREFCCNPLKLLVHWTPESQNRARFRKIPCRFPCYQGIGCGDRYAWDCIPSHAFS